MVIVHTYGLILFHFLMLMKIVLALKDADVQCRGLFLSTEFTKRRTHTCIVAYTSAILELKGEASKMGGDAPFGPKKGGGDVPFVRYHIWIQIILGTYVVLSHFLYATKLNVMDA